MMSPAGCGGLLLAPLIAGVIGGTVIWVTGRARPRVVKSGRSIFGMVGKILCMTGAAWIVHKAITLDHDLRDRQRR